ncbi:DUF4157 domain-containing protein [Flavobacterium sp. CLA17]|uniref:eCIS core domain-containing protein n=1 Tax=Flavobacterium sp. CLA17 TaxID=2724135 RepID=UPI001492D68A|nr:DUF4157 domain-containing protein [Flavobacterium sp. CLA17]QSB25576.1 DUF4157 domain-containing protein [Flavobacterium sp. CLA17]
MEQSNYIKNNIKTQSVSNSLTTKTTQNKAITLEDNRPASLLQRKANHTGLPDPLKSGIENLSGHSMDDVKVHYNSDKPAQLNAHAYAQGTDIHIASGQEKHLPHEAWHVVQQKQGRVKPTLQMKGKVNVNDDKGLEKEADVMGAKALNTTHSTQLKVLKKKPANSYVVQNVRSKETAKEKFDRQMKEMNERIKKANEKIDNIHKIKAELGIDATATPMNPAFFVGAFPTTDHLDISKKEARLANFSSMVKEFVNAMQKNNVTPEIQTALVKTALGASESIYVSGNTSNANNKIRGKKAMVLGDYYKANIRPISVRRRAKGIENVARSMGYKAKGRYVVKKDFRAKIKVVKGDTENTIAQKIIRNLLTEHKRNPLRLTGTSSRKFARAHASKQMNVPTNKENIHAESAILASIRDTKQKILEIGGTKVACMACQAYFTKLGEHELLGDHTGYGWISKSSLAQIKLLIDSIETAEDYLVSLVKILESRLLSLKRFTGAAGDKNVEDAEPESDADDTDSEDEDSLVLLEKSSVIREIALALLNS